MSKGNAIAFGSDFIDNATKSIDGTYQNNGTGVNALTQFHVYGTVKNGNGLANIFNEELVEKQTSGAWDETTATTAADYKVNFGNISDVQNGQSATIATEKLLIPTTQTLTVTFTVDICNGNTVITSTPYTKTIETNLVAGYSYNIVIKQSLGSKIEFTVTANPTWTPAADDNIQL